MVQVYECWTNISFEGEIQNSVSDIDPLRLQPTNLGLDAAPMLKT